MKTKNRLFPFRCENKDCKEVFIPFSRGPGYLALAKNSAALSEQSTKLAEQYKTLAENSMDPAKRVKILGEQYASLFEQSEEFVRQSESIARDAEDVAKKYDEIANDATEISKKSAAIADQSWALYERFDEAMNKRDETSAEKPPFPPPPPTQPESHSYFDEVVKLLGFICLGDGSFLYFGFTCPKCKKTTIYRYRWEKVQREFDIVFTDMSNKIGGKQYFAEEVKWFIVPFSVSILIDTINQYKPPEGLNGIEETDRNAVRMITIGGGLTEMPSPKCLPIYILPGSFPYLINSDDIDKFLKIENEQGFKVFPRVVLKESIYLLLDRLNKDLYGTDGTTTDYHNSMKKVMSEAVKRCQREQEESSSSTLFSWSSTSWTRDYDKRSKISFKKLGLDRHIEEDILKKNASGLRNYYIKTRNRIDFEFTYKKDLIRTYAKILLGKGPKTYEPAEKERNRLREKAEKIWKKHPDWSIARVAREIKEEFGKTTLGQRKIEDHIRDLSPKKK